MNQMQQIIENISKLPNKTFIENENDSLQTIDFVNSVNIKLDVLNKQDVTPNSIVLLPTGNSLQYFVDMCACWLAGATVVPITHTASKSYLSYLFDTLEKPDKVAATLTSNDIIHWENSSYSKYATIWFTSGSSGTPKGVLHTFDNLIGNAQATANTTGINHHDKLFTNIPYNFTSLICHFLSILVSGASLVAIENKLFPKNLFEIVNSSKPSCFGGAPLQILWLAETENLLSHTLRWCMSSGDDLPVSTIKSFQSKYPDTNIFTVYGLTEIGGRGCILKPEFLISNAGSVGTPIDGLKISIRDESHIELPVDQTGEVYFSGNYLLKGFADPKHNGAITKFGYKTGDLGFINTDGFLYLKGRADDVFKVAGQKVSGLQIRREILATNWFSDAAVSSKTDPVYGVIPVAVLVLKESTSISKSDLISILRKTLPTNHIPKEFLLSKTIERTDSGKIKKNALTALLKTNLEKLA